MAEEHSERTQNITTHNKIHILYRLQNIDWMRSTTSARMMKCEMILVHVYKANTSTTLAELLLLTGC